MTREQFEADLGFPPDPFQRHAFDALDTDHSVLVAAPTGAGKTVVAEYAVARALAEGRKAFYTTPIKALSNQKYGDFVRRYGRSQVGLLTGDNAINGDAPVVVMTTEVLRNMIYEGSPALEGLAVVVLDEVHYLQDPYRGAVWEEVIIHLAPPVRLVCLSATVSNAEEFGDWLFTVRGDTRVIIDDQRPVELRHFYGVAPRHRDRVLLLPTFVEDERGRLVPNRDAPAYDPSGPVRGRRRPEPDRHRGRPATPGRLDVVDELADRGMLPAIYFIFSRAGCDEAVDRFRAFGVRLTNEEEAERIRRIAEDHVAGLPDSDLEVLEYGRWLDGLSAGVAAHHAGMVPPMKEAVEEAFATGLVKVVFATETLALGINMPARTVVIERLSKFTGERHQMLTPGEYTQLTGRAGRRGIDDVGFAVVLWNRFVVFDQVASLASKRTYELTSSFRPTYNMAVNLVRRYEREEAHHLLNLSFAQYRADRGVVALERQAESLHERVTELREAARCERGDIDGYQRLVDRWERARRDDGASGRADEALGRLRPGDVVHAGGRVGPVVVIRRTSGKGGGTWVTALSTRGRTVRLSASSFREPPQAYARIELPEPFRPKSQDFRRVAVHRLRQAASGTGSGGRPTPRQARRAERLGREVHDHPVRSCPELADHLQALEQLRRLERQMRRLDDQTGRRPDTLARRFDDVLDLLAERGYVDVGGWRLEEPGFMLSRIYGESDLLVSEAVRHEVFADLDPASLAAVVSLFTYEFRGPEGAAPEPRWPTPLVARRARALQDLSDELRADEAGRDLPETRAPDPGLADVVYAWARGGSLEDVIGEDEMTGGDFVRNLKQLIDLLRQLGDAVEDRAVASCARKAAEALFRGVVEASSRVHA